MKGRKKLQFKSLPLPDFKLNNWFCRIHNYSFKSVSLNICCVRANKTLRIPARTSYVQAYNMFTDCKWEIKSLFVIETFTSRKKINEAVQETRPMSMKGATNATKTRDQLLINS